MSNIKFKHVTSICQKMVQYTGADPTCKCGKKGIVRLPHLANKISASKQVYISCNKCFNKTWQ